MHTTTSTFFFTLHREKVSDLLFKLSVSNTHLVNFTTCGFLLMRAVQWGFCQYGQFAAINLEAPHFPDFLGV